MTLQRTVGRSLLTRQQKLGYCKGLERPHICMEKRWAAGTWGFWGNPQLQAIIRDIIATLSRHWPGAYARDENAIVY